MELRLDGTGNGIVAVAQAETGHGLPLVKVAEILKIIGDIAHDGGILVFAQAVAGVQAENAPSMAKSRQTGEIVTLDTVSTFADGIAVKTPGDLTYALTRQFVDDIVTVTEDEIAAAILALIEQQKLIAEGAGAVSVAAAMFHKLPIEGKKVVCIVSGGNIDVNILSRVITRGLITSGRSTMLQIELEDKPGQLEGVSRIISECGGNVISVHHERSDANMPISSCILRIGMETASFEQIRTIREALTGAGFRIHEADTSY